MNAPVMTATSTTIFPIISGHSFATRRKYHRPQKSDFMGRDSHEENTKLAYA